MSIEVYSSPAAVQRQHQTELSTPNRAAKPAQALFRCPRDSLLNRFVYLTISPRANGLSAGVNLSPDAQCNFGCLYCDVDHTLARPDCRIDCEIAGQELEKTLKLLQSGSLRGYAPYTTLPEELLQLRHVELSGDGEPTMSPQFREVVETIVHVRARGRFPFFKIVLITNGAGLHFPEVQEGLGLLTPQDEVWVKLESGSQPYMEMVNRSTVSLDKILSNILLTAIKRPVIIQSLFSSVDGSAPPLAEIAAYAQRLRELKEQGANIVKVQIYSATHPTATRRVAHLPLRTLSEIASTVRRVTGLRAEVY